MAKRIFVTATNTDIGKTYTTKLLMKAYAAKGLSVGVIKPIETGVVDGVALDGESLLQTLKEVNPSLWSLEVEDIVPIQYELPASPLVSSKNTPLDLHKIEKSLFKLEDTCDVVIIEGAGGLYVPIDQEWMIIDLIAYLKATTLLVTHCSLGCINDTILSQKALEAHTISYLTAYNCKEQDKGFEKVSLPYYEAIGQKILKVDDDIDIISELLYNL